MTDHHSNGNAKIDEPMTVAIVLDKSGSMQPLREAVVDAYNGFLRELAEDDGDLRVSLTSFDTSFNHVYVAQPLPAVSPLSYSEYVPDGMTALFDAVAHTALETERQLVAAGRAGERVLIAVITDGEENSSTDYDAARLARLVADFEERGSWTFVYLGAAHASLADARRVSSSFGIKDGNAMRWDASPASALASMSSLAAGTKARRAAASRRSDDFFADAGQTEGDYLGEGDTMPKPGPSNRPRRTQKLFKQRSLREELIDLTNEQEG
jgi:uncharacterized protein YegL